MKKIFFIVFLLFLGSVYTTIIAKDRPKVGVVLCGGGAKGAAHIGVLKVLEEAGIPIDYIAGTSMGAIIGGLYSIGYDSQMLDSLVKKQDWNYLLSDETYRYNLPLSEKEKPRDFLFSLAIQPKVGVKLPPGIVSGQNIYNLFLDLTTGFHNPMDFKKLPIPFACIAVNLRDASEVVLDKGVLPMAMRASMSIPGLFNPVEKDSMSLIDGGVLNNYPADVLKKMGADIIIGVDLPPDSAKKVLSKGSLMEYAYNATNITEGKKHEENLKMTDIVVSVNLSNYNILSFQRPALDSIIKRGEYAALGKWNELMKLKEKLLGTDNTTFKRKRYVNPYIHMDTIFIKTIHINGLSPKEEKMVLGKIKLSNKVTRKDIQNIVALLYGTGFFKSVYYYLDDQPPFDLVFDIKKNNMNMLNTSFRFDSENLAAILLNSTVRLNTLLNSAFDITARLSNNPYLTIDYSLNSTFLYKGGITFSTSKNSFNVYDDGKLFYNLSFYKHSLDLNFSEFYINNVKFRLEANFDYFHSFQALYSKRDLLSNEWESKPYIRYILSGTYDRLDKTYLPTRGTYFSLKFNLYTDNFIQMNKGIPSQVVDVLFKKPISLTKKMVITPGLQSRMLIYGENLPTIYRNFVGGYWDNYNLNQQISLHGQKGMEMLENSVVKTQLNLRYNFRGTNHIYSDLNFVTHNDHITKIFKGKKIFSGSVGLVRNTIAGPLRLELGYSSLSKKIYPFVSFGYFF